ncbi:KdsC family phosphatase [Sulfurimonas paralvinellae]|uniref:3-deoxy-D-manno-octulosonate 8-phosphate phosphatase KdsC n=1 Tax=Sulfurimonas paralvinellae TaxID=317658 RepID=A0A7M1B7N5_9BACT|nr:HAD-IIIA family hydrolase [Sulfurimonas paralvinellae]QOP45665.1 HAD-IIIA family hydrolase [Sulfurimonas paralvinellae]
MIKLLVLDVDGCLTDGKIIYTSNSSEIKEFNVKDGLAIASWIKMGHHVAIITGRNSAIVKRRSDELQIQHLQQGVNDKATALRELVSSLGLEFYEVAAIGDDLNDYEMLSMAGRSFTPKDGVKDIQEIVDTVLSKKGGDAAVREMIDIIIEENDQKDEFLSLWIKE